VSAQIAAVAPNPDCGGVDTDSLLTATQWHRRLFRGPVSVWQYDADDYDDDGGVG
jgi:hypothetical protein